ncbi:MAG TPA: hypothetical protein VMA09_12625 [Candidatus Binataceae bacterium]|nr:hypothetical protein [Candidatus Binataceae bacterium]
MSEQSGFWEEFRHKIVNYSSMDRDVRIAFQSGSATVVIAIVLNLFGGHLGRAVHTLAGDIPIATLLFLIAGETIVVTFIALAVLLVRGRAKTTIVSVLATLLVLVMILNGIELCLGLLVPAALLSIFAVLASKRHWSTIQRVQGAITVAFTTIATIEIYAAAGYHVIAISILGFQATAAMFGLFMAATDIAEIAMLASEAATRGIRKLGHSRVPVVVITLFSIAMNVWVTTRFVAGSGTILAAAIGSGLGIGMWIGLIYLMLRRSHKRLTQIPPHIGYRPLLVVVALYFVTLQAGLMWRFISNPVTYDPAQMFSYSKVFIFPFLVFVVAVVLFYAVGGRSRHRFAFFGLGASIGMMWFLDYSSHGEAFVDVYYSVAVGTLLMLLFALVRRIPRFVGYGMLLCELNICFLLYGLLVLAFLSARGSPGRLTVPQALVVFAALAWDILSSGEIASNVHTTRVPRLARVSFFFAYVISVALLVMASTTSHLVNPFNAKEVEGLFESEPLVATGLALLGAPFFIFIYSLRIRHLLESDEGAEPPRVAHSGGATA